MSPMTPLLAVVLALCASARGHALVSWPRQVGLVSTNDFNLTHLAALAKPDFCPHCLNGGGKRAVVAAAPGGLWTPYEPTDSSFPFRDDHGVCGDAKGGGAHLAPHGVYFANITLATYAEGDFLDAEALVNVHHNGYFEFFLCDMDACGGAALRNDCFVKGSCTKLMRVPHPACEGGRDRYCGPVDEAYPGRWYLPPPHKQHISDNWYGGRSKKMRYALPEGVTCERCIVHWYWATANSCNPPGYANYSFPRRWEGLPGDGASTGGINTNFPECGSSAKAFPEEFWACSENIVIKPRRQRAARTKQIFHDGEMNIEGPGDSSTHRPGVIKPSQPAASAAPSMMLPSETGASSGEQEARPTERSRAMDGKALDILPESDEGAIAVTPSMMPSQRAAEAYGDQKKTRPTEESAGGAEDEESYMPPVESGERRNASKYNLMRYVSTFDTGKCFPVDKGLSFCQACLDFGHGVTKCMWCMAHENGRGECYADMPTHL